jgi:glycosyltransferase involved in cell wall biosynthesis
MQKRSFKTILFIGSFLSKHRGSIGPTEQLAKYLNQNNFKVKLASTYQNRIARLIDTIIKLLFYSGEILYIDVYSGNAFRIAEISAFIGKLRNMKLVFMLHGGALPDFLRNHQNRVKQLFENQTNIFSPSQYIINVFKQHNIRVKYQPNGIDLSRFPFNTNNSNKPISLLWVRAFDSIYNPDVAVKILKEIKYKFPESTLTMIGPDRGLLNQTKELVRKLNLNENVFFGGPIENNKLYQYYQNHSILINTTSFESFGVSLVEAASSGIPIISNNVGEIPLLWKNNVNIRLIENNDIDQFVNQIKILNENESVRTEQIKKAQKNTMQFNSNTTNTFWYNILNSL